MMTRLLVVLICAALAMAGPAAAADVKFKAELSGDQEIPARTTDGEGEAEFELDDGILVFELKWKDLTSPAFAAHIHCGGPTVNGPVGVTLFTGAMGTSGEVRGVITAPDANNRCGWADVDDVLDAMAAGLAYVNVHTATFPGGEIRGQIGSD
jgi:hypothetical protein